MTIKKKRGRKKKKIPKHPQSPTGKFIKKKNRPDAEILAEMDVDMDPRKQAFAVAYFDPLSNTHGNALQSALKAGFAQQYAESIIAQKTKWLSDLLGRMDLMNDLKRNLKYHVNLPIKVPAMGPFGPILDKKTKKPIMVESNIRLKLRQDMTIFALEKLDPDFKKKDKDDPILNKVEIKQIIIIAPDGKSIDYNSSNAEAVSSLPEAS